MRRRLPLVMSAARLSLSDRFRPQALMRAALLGASLLAAPGVTSAQAAAQHYDLPAGSLDDALSAFSRQAGITLSFASDLVAGKNAPALQGDYGVVEGFDRLLRDSGLEAVPDAGGSWSLRAAPPTVKGATLMQAVKVEAQLSDPLITEGSRSYAAKAVGVGGKTARDPKQIPQSVTVVTAQRIRDQVLTTTEEALAQANGVTLVQQPGYGVTASFLSRGFDMAMQVDGGMPGVNDFWYQTGLPDLAILDHVEVLRGSDGLFSGVGNPGGVVNLVRKRALDQNQVVFDALAASWDRYRTQIDATGPLGFDGKLRGRFVAARENRHFFQDVAQSEKTVLYSVVEADLSSRTLLSVGMSSEDEDRQGIDSMGLPRYVSGADLGLPRDTCLCNDWSLRHDANRELFVKLEQSLTDDWSLRINVSKRWLDYDVMEGNSYGSVDPATGAGPVLTMYRTDVANRTKLADAVVHGRFEIFGLEQELLIGANWQDMFSDGTGVQLAEYVIPDIFDFDPGAVPQPGVPADYVPLEPFGGQKQTGIYASLRTSWTDALHTTIGLRNSSYEYLYPPGEQRYKDRNARTPYAGISYDLNPAITLYGSYAQIFQTQYGNLEPSGKLLDPIEGNTYEIGAKGAWFDGALTASVAVYDIRRENAAILLYRDAENPSCCYRAAAEVQSRGFDAEVVGQLRPGWELSFGYSYNENEFKSGYDDDDGKPYSPQTPKHLLKLWTTAQMPGNWSALKLGGGVNWQSANFVSGSVPSYNSESGEFDGLSVPFKYKQSAYAIASLRAEYRVNTQWSTALNVNNLFDETYYQTIGPSDYGNYYGEPRHWIVSVNGRW